MVQQIRKLIFTQIDLPVYLEQEFGAKLMRRDNGDYQCRCPFPFHQDSKPSFSVQYRSGGWFWYCYGCGVGGTIIEFVERYYSLSSVDSIEKICDLFEISNDPQSCIEAMKRTEGTKSIKKEFESEFIRLSSVCRNILHDYPGDKETLEIIKKAYIDSNDALEVSDLEKLKSVRTEIVRFIKR